MEILKKLCRSGAYNHYKYDFYAWNPAIENEFTGLDVGDYVSAPATITTSASKTATTITDVVTPTPTQTGMVSGCDEFYYVASGDDCEGIAGEYSISLDDFHEWNPAIGDMCAGLWTDYYVCVGVE
ncbi:hypothetical protein N7494_011649 [Penicillium frequentans]|uniref:LysM domain-containing protein n=1 Tax=Penicillium frequentans TaxID=3151616 RepID=A0AAD6CMQ2_9EURO|nr:hypothetical protein N7494_011649 [Penicillium glabrum]